MDFNLLMKATKEHPKILDSIGIINFMFKSEENENGNKATSS